MRPDRLQPRRDVPNTCCRSLENTRCVRIEKSKIRGVRIEENIKYIHVMSLLAIPVTKRGCNPSEEQTPPHIGLSDGGRKSTHGGLTESMVWPAGMGSVLRTSLALVPMLLVPHFAAGADSREAAARESDALQLSMVALPFLDGRYREIGMRDGRRLGPLLHSEWTHNPMFVPSFALLRFCSFLELSLR